MVLAPNHYLLLDATQRLAGVLRDAINREPHPTKKLMRRKIQLCENLLPVLDKLCPGISRTKGTSYNMTSLMKVSRARPTRGSVLMKPLVLVWQGLGNPPMLWCHLGPYSYPQSDRRIVLLKVIKGNKKIFCVLSGMFFPSSDYVVWITRDYGAVGEKTVRQSRNHGIRIHGNTYFLL